MTNPLAVTVHASLPEKLHRETAGGARGTGTLAGPASLQALAVFGGTPPDGCLVEHLVRERQIGGVEAGDRQGSHAPSLPA